MTVGRDTTARSMVLVDATPLQSEHRERGVGTYTRHLAEEMVALAPGRVCFAATARDVNRLPPEVRARAFTARRGHRPAQVYWIYNEWFLRYLIRRARPRVFHATDFNGLVTVPGVRTVATVHDCTALKEGLHHSSLSGRLSDLRWWVYYRHKLSRVDHIIAVSEHVKRDVVELVGIAAERITVIPHGVDLNRFRPVRGAGAYGREMPYLLFVGGRAPNKNLDRVLQAFAAVASEAPDLQLFIAGRWRKDDLTWLDRTGAELGIRSRVRHLGFVPDDNLPSLYANATAFLFPSLEEGFGLPILEAMACGTPVLTSTRSQLVETAGSAARLVDPTNVQEITAGMLEIVCDTQLREQLVDLGLARAQSFRWGDVARRTLEVYRMVRTDDPAVR